MAWVSDAVFSALILASCVLTASTLGLAVAWIRARERAIRAEQRPAPALGGDARLERMEQAMEAMTLEIERMAEGQRFVTRLLAEGSTEARDARAQPAHVGTPT